MTEKDLLQRTKTFALRGIKLVDALPNTIAGRKIGDQLLRSGTSVAANYRAAKPNLSPNWELLRKKQMKVPCGWS
jgi:four helix bundle protein